MKEDYREGCIKQSYEDDNVNPCFYCAIFHGSHSSEIHWVTHGMQGYISTNRSVLAPLLALLGNTVVVTGQERSSI